MIQETGVIVPGQAELEISHHYGVARFEEVGSDHHQSSEPRIL